MMDKKYWIWLQLCLGQGASFKEIIEDFGSVQKLYEGGLFEWKLSPSISQKQAERLLSFKLEDAEKIISDCESNSWSIITYDDALYPQRLKEISNPPAVLYIDGSIEGYEELAPLAVVGTRKASTYALRAARIMAKGYALCGGAVVSGGALGVDSAAHRGALEAGGITYAVLGCGFGVDHLNENKDLRNEIKASGGALISEYPPRTPATKFNFPMRNRIISALSLGTLVVEAGQKSGSLITANYAAEQGRDIFAIPASIFDSHFLGTNLLIDDGAVVATSPSVIVAQYAERFETLDLSKALSVQELASIGDKINKTTKKSDRIDFDNMPQDRVKRVNLSNKENNLSNNEKAVFEALNDELQTIESITDKCKLNLNEVLSSLTLLEMEGLITSASGQRYKKR